MTTPSSSLRGTEPGGTHAQSASARRRSSPQRGGCSCTTGFARLGLALLDAERPDQVLARSSEWIFGPDAPYERTGDVSQVVFSCGWLLLDDGDTLRIYYGAADTSVCVATASLSALLRWLAAHSA